MRQVHLSVVGAYARVMDLGGIGRYALSIFGEESMVCDAIARPIVSLIFIQIDAPLRCSVLIWELYNWSGSGNVGYIVAFREGLSRESIRGT